MQFLYNIAIGLADLFLPIIALFSSKMKRSHLGRKETFSKLKQNISSSDSVIWIHCASLGEFEQGRPIIEHLAIEYPNDKIVLSFFSPSGYEVRKDYDKVAAVVYLPLDTKKKTSHFLEILNPRLAIFVKYEIWPNILQELSKRRIKTIIISGIFRKEQHFFSKNNNWYRKPLDAFAHFFVQDQNSVALLKSIGFENTTLSGDTRFDRVFELVSQREKLDFLEDFTSGKHTLVAGSTWDKDELLLADYINTQALENEVFIFAPHNIKQEGIQRLIKQIKGNVVLYSKATNTAIATAQVLIIDSVGKLTSVYAYADVAYVGGGFGTGIHNILEPATYGIPIVIGPKYDKFKEAKDLITTGACIVVQDQKDLNKTLNEFKTNTEILTKKGNLALQYIKDNIGASDLIFNWIKVNAKH